MTYLIADDDPMYRAFTKDYLDMVPDLQCVAECENALEASVVLQKTMPDLLILDVAMPGLSGMQLARSLVNQPMIIFITSHTEFAADAFEVDAIDYLVKPVIQERLMKAIDKARSLHNLKLQSKGHDNIRMQGEEAFFIRENNAYTKVLYDDITYIESLGDFVHIYLSNGQRKIALVNLKNLEQQLPSATFIRISRAHMIHKMKVTTLDSNAVSLDKIRLPLGKAFAEQVTQQILGKSIIKRHI